MVNPPRFLIITYQAQGHINPALQFAKRLTSIGAHVTFFTSLSAYRRMAKDSSSSSSNLNTIVDSLLFSHFSDGYDDGFKPGDDVNHYFSEIRRRGSQALWDLIISSANEGHPFRCLVYTFMLPWAAKVADELGVPSALLWIQPATVLDIYYYYFHGYGDMFNNNNGPSSSIELPGLPLKLTGRDLPSFMDSANTYSFFLPILKELFEILLEKEGKSKSVLVNTFDALEPEALRSITKFDLIAIGPLVPSAFLDGKDPSDTSFGGDLYKGSKDYNEWLNSKPKASVIYVSFGSMSVLSKPQMEEIGRGLLGFGRPFLWVITERQNPEENKGEGGLSCGDELERFGKIVQWCSQLEVLSNPSLGCFVTHCGWNSTLESLVCGVPMVGFPQWSDQRTNAKLIEDSWKVGVRVRVNKEGIVEGDEIKRCLELVTGDGEKGEEIRRNAKKWKDFSREAAMEGGSSHKNLIAFSDATVQD